MQKPRQAPSLITLGAAQQYHCHRIWQGKQGSRLPPDFGLF